MTPQEILNTAYNRLLQQGRPCQDDQHRCWYTNPEDHTQHCLVGLLLPPEIAAHLDKVSPGTSILSHLEKRPDVLPDWVGPNIALLSALQSLHDNLPPRPFTRLNFSSIAHRFNLEDPSK